MKPELLYGEFDKGQLFQIETVGGRNLQGQAIFADNGFTCIAFKIDKYETVPAKSVRNADKILDYYYSPQAAARNGYCTANLVAYTEATPTGSKPRSRQGDLQYIKTASSCDIKSFKKNRGYHLVHKRLKPF